MEFFKEHFDKLLLTFLFLVVFGSVMHMAHHSIDTQDVAWARESAGTILGALLGLITGVKIGMAIAAGKQDNGSPGAK